MSASTRIASKTARAVAPFHTHLTFYSTTPTPTAALSSSPRITLYSGLRRSLALGLNFPCSVLNTFALRLTCGSASNLFLRPIDVLSIPPRTMLEDVDLPLVSAGPGQAPGDLITASRAAGKDLGDIVHVLVLWLFGAQVSTKLLDKEALEACRKGELFWEVERRRRYRDDGAGEVLPFWRGGPISVAGHAWAVRTLFGVSVYQSAARKLRTTQ